MTAPPRYPVMLDLVGRPCLVVGGGPVALRKVRGLREAGAAITVVAPVLVADLADLASAGSVIWVQRTVAAGELAGADQEVSAAEQLSPAELATLEPWRFAVAATGDRAVNELLARELDQRGVWVVDASTPDGGSATTPAIHRDGPLTVAVSTSGVSPGAAAWLRDQVASSLDPAVAAAIDLLSELLEEGAGAVNGHTRTPQTRVDWKRVVDSGTLDDIRHGHRARAKERLKACLSSSSD